MKIFECHPILSRYDTVECFFQAVDVKYDDLILTNRFILDADRQQCFGAQVIYQEEYGAGEPTDEMLLAIKQAVKRPYRRVIGIGGGTVLDLSKLLGLEGLESLDEIQDIMLGKRAVRKRCSILLVPTTCGTGSEMTNVAVLLLRRMNIKIGLAAPEMYADCAALIPALLQTLPRKPMIFSAIDALIHACESYLSPKATTITRMFSIEATRRILDCFAKIAAGACADMRILDCLLEASTMAGIAFGNAGCGTVHAMSYPIGGKFHLPHGESNYEVFIPVLRAYRRMENRVPLTEWLNVVREAIHSESADALDALEELLNTICKRRSLREIGMTESDCHAFARDVVEKQQRLLLNAMCPMSLEAIEKIYQNA